MAAARANIKVLFIEYASSFGCYVFGRRSRLALSRADIPENTASSITPHGNLQQKITQKITKGRIALLRVCFPSDRALER